jgi:hypothetical protein
MKSPVITPAHQLTLDWEPGLVDQHRNLRDCVATCIYKRGLTDVAGQIDEAPSNLSVQLSDGVTRKFSVDSLERYIAKYNDLTPIFYLIEKFMGDKMKAKEAAQAQLAQVGPDLVKLLRKAGYA